MLLTHKSTATMSIRMSLVGLFLLATLRASVGVSEIGKMAAYMKPAQHVHYNEHTYKTPYKLYATKTIVVNYIYGQT